MSRQDALALALDTVIPVVSHATRVPGHFVTGSFAGLDWHR
jgi:hypothetical protein